MLMNGGVSTMLKAVRGVAWLMAVAYAALPVAREWFVALSPFLFVLICPLMMLFMMRGMQSCHSDSDSKSGGPTQAQIPEGTNAGGHSRPPAPANRFDA